MKKVLVLVLALPLTLGACSRKGGGAPPPVAVSSEPLLNLALSVSSPHPPAAPVFISPELQDPMIGWDARHTGEGLEALTPLQRERLARLVAESHDWEAEVIREREQASHSMPSLDLDDEDGYMKRIIVPHIRRKAHDEAIVSLTNREKPFWDTIDVFELVARYGIAPHPEEKSGWNFLWFFAAMNEEELPYADAIVRALERNRLESFPYGRKMSLLLKRKGFRLNDGKIL